MGLHAARAGLLAVSVLATTPLLLAQSTLRKGGEFQVNSYTSDFQMSPTVDLTGNGGFIVAWVSYGQDRSDNGIFARRFSAAGFSQASEFQVNAYTPGDQRYPFLAFDADGAFIVAWTSKGQDGADYGIFARRFSSSGVVQGTEFQVNSRTDNVENYPVIGIDSEGDVVVVWSSQAQDGDNTGIFAQRFDSAGARLAFEFQVNSRTQLGQNSPSLAVAADGDFLVVWESSSQESLGTGVFGQRFNSAGAAQAVEFQVNVYTPSSQSAPAVAVDGDGDFIVAWQSYDQDGGNYGVFARRVDASGTPQGSEFQVNSRTALAQRFPAVASDSDGDFLVSWTSYGADGADTGVLARRFDSAGAPQGAEFQVNTYTTGFQRVFAIGTEGGGRFVIVWDSINQDGSGEGVFAQRLGPAAVLDIDGNGSTSPLTDGLLVLRFQFGFTGTTLTSGAVGAGCARCEAAAITPYLSGLGATLDIDGNTLIGPLTDGLLVLRFLFGFSGATLTTGAVGGGCSRCDATAIGVYLETLI